MAKKIKNPVQQGLNSICKGNQAAIGRVFGVTRQSVSQWVKYGTVPKHYMRAFSALTGISIETLLEYEELTAGVSYESFTRAARKRAQEEESSV